MDGINATLRTQSEVDLVSELLTSDPRILALFSAIQQQTKATESTLNKFHVLIAAAQQIEDPTALTQNAQELSELQTLLKDLNKRVTHLQASLDVTIKHRKTLEALVSKLSQSFSP